MVDAPQALENLLTEERVFPPSDAFVARANATDAIYAEAETDWLGFWRDQALSRVSWFKEPTTVLECAADHGLPVALLCDGRDVRAHLWRATPGRLADVVLRGRWS